MHRSSRRLPHLPQSSPSAPHRLCPYHASSPRDRGVILMCVFAFRCFVFFVRILCFFFFFPGGLSSSALSSATAGGNLQSLVGCLDLLPFLGDLAAVSR